ncbi:hypothetical protein [Streptomyces sp. NPDC089919]|uniref:hypothetical protein n=1 Tax=Streptomyces sp. NPDC089919 TaxID=3155188 RepID=UPI003440352E
MTQSTTEAPAASHAGRRYAAAAAVYHRSVEAVLAQPAVVDRLQTRPEVTAEAVREAMTAPAAVARVHLLGRDAFDRARTELERRTRARQGAARARAQLGADPLTLAALLCVVGTVAMAVTYAGTFAPIRLQLAVGLGTSVVYLWAYSRERSRRQLRALASYVNRRAVGWLCRGLVRNSLLDLEADLVAHGTRQVVLEVIEALLGADPHSVLLYDDYHGLRARGDARFFVRNACADQLARKLGLLDGGTIALSGPRGAGKTTLLHAAGALRADRPQDADAPDLVSTVAVPAAYTPYDFLVACSIRVCEAYLARTGQRVPELTRLSRLVHWRRGAADALHRGTRWAVAMVPAVALVVLGSGAALRWWWSGHRDGLLDLAGAAGRGAGGAAGSLWRGDSTLLCLTTVFLGLTAAGLRDPGRLRRMLGLAPGTRPGWQALWLSGWFLLALACADLLAVYLRSLDSFAEFWRQLNHAVLGFGLATLVCAALMLAVGRLERPRRLTAGDRTLLGAALAGPLWLAIMAALDATSPIVHDRANPARLALAAAGLALVGCARHRRHRPAARPTELARRCEDQLYRLRTVQGTAATLNLAPVPLLGSSHGSTLSATAPNFPQLVAEFRELVEDIAEELRTEGNGYVFLCIDELDRMDSPEKARAFLAEIKAILGIPRVYCLVSVAEDVSAGFVRRGLPHRDATDSAFDDVVHVRSMTFEESVAVLAERLPGLPRPYAVLAHALSGGIPRDLIRYALTLVELRQGTPYVELPDIAVLMLAEELADTLTGFRTLLAGHEWTAGSASVLIAHRTLTERLAAACPHRADALIGALAAFVRPGPAGAPGADPVPESARSLVAEARAYAAFGLTLFEIFTPADFDRRSALVAAAEPDGSAQRLADLRLELAVSPYSALALADRVRGAWGLPDLRAATGPVPAPAGPCPLPPCAPAVPPPVPSP